MVWFLAGPALGSDLLLPRRGLSACPITSYVGRCDQVDFLGLILWRR